MLQPLAILLGVMTLVVALAITAHFVPGVMYEGPLGLVGAALLYEILTLGIWLTWPSLLADMGLLRMIGPILINAALLWFVGKVVPGFEVNGLGSAILGALVVGVAQFPAGFLISFARMGGLAS